MRIFTGTAATLLLFSLSLAQAQPTQCDGSAGTGTNRSAVTGSGCPIGKPGTPPKPLSAAPDIGNAPSNNGKDRSKRGTVPQSDPSDESGNR